jgi:hypothetical protein
MSQLDRTFPRLFLFNNGSKIMPCSGPGEKRRRLSGCFVD